jgi:7,8-dihydropterin-6-yl-methyl-4-(beta-D-ribofuranosyl)aminobenzene 5'-phosphate synthase
MSVRLGLEPVDRVEITTLYENLVDMTMPGEPRAARLDSKAEPAIASPLLAGAQRAEFVGGHGLSLQISVTRGGMTRSLLYDTGGTPDGLVHNLDCLGIDPRDWACIVLSHGHWDHTLGLIGLQRRLGILNYPLILHPDAYRERATVAPGGKINRMVSLSRAGLLDAGLELVEAKGPTPALDGMVLVTGQVERTNNVEIGWPAHHAERNGTLEPDPFIWDDQGLVVNLKDRGLVVVSGCAHAGIINTIHYAQAVTGIERVHAVLGGFHLGPSFFHDRIDWVVQALVALEPAVIVPAHCTGYRAAYAVYQRRPDAFIQNTVGTRITLASDA